MRSDGWNPLAKNYPDLEAVNAVSLGAETLYTRLIAQSDDAGHYYGEAMFILARLYTTRMVNGQVGEKQVAGWLEELEQAGLILRYQAQGRTYLELINVQKFHRKDVKLDLVFPARNESVTDTSRVRHESVTDTARVRNESVTLYPYHTHTHTNTHTETETKPPPPAATDTPAASDSSSSSIPEIPPSLRTEAFGEAWEAWRKHRREIGKRLTPSATRRQLAYLAQLGPPRAIAAIERSITNGWTGIFEEKPHGTRAQQPPHAAGGQFAETIRLE
jgi:hypothetical protein